VERLRALEGAVRTVLVVDDDPDTLRLLKRMLGARPLSCRVEVAGGGEEALAMLTRVRPDVVLLDLAMPGLDGYGVLARMRMQAGPPIPVIAVTGRDDPEETMIVDALLVTRGAGLAAGELIPCLGASLNALLALPSSGRAPAEANHG
jgi:CheY-like chemotaxis protein